MRESTGLLLLLLLLQLHPEEGGREGAADQKTHRKKWGKKGQRERF